MHRAGSRTRFGPSSPREQTVSSRRPFRAALDDPCALPAQRPGAPRYPRSRCSGRSFRDVEGAHGLRRSAARLHDLAGAECPQSACRRARAAPRGCGAGACPSRGRGLPHLDHQGSGPGLARVSCTSGPPPGGPEPVVLDLRHPRDRRMPVLASAGLMFLKSLTLRGFKSFAEKTTLDFEPGITVIVGPNGSGKSNVVDAIPWVLGDRGPTSRPGGKMEDVLFAGTGSRGALGRAEVALTIDNAAGLLSIEYTEVTVTRLLYRSGESEYAISAPPGSPLDIQELLSDTGVGRELHTVLGQNRLEDVLPGRSEDRRAAIEAAARGLQRRA